MISFVGRNIGSYIAPVQTSSENKYDTGQLDQVATNGKCGKLYRTKLHPGIPTNTLTLHFVGNADFIEHDSLSNAYYLNWPLNAHCSNAKILMSYMQDHINSIIQKHPTIKKITLRGHSLGGFAALNMADYLRSKNQGFEVDVVTINTFSKITDVITKGMFFNSVKTLTTIAVALIVTPILGLINGLIATTIFWVISSYFNSLAYVPIQCLIKFCGWEMNNIALVRKLDPEINIKMKQSDNDELFINKARLSSHFKEKEIEMYGNHNRFTE